MLRRNCPFKSPWNQ